jgi:mono/diheme cytochrome c family protein
MANWNPSDWIHRSLTAAVAVCLLMPVACQQEMADQPSYKPLDPSTFYPDGRSARPLVPGTVARGHLRADLHLFAGKKQGARTGAALIGMAVAGAVPAASTLAAMGRSEYLEDVDTFPFPVTRNVLRRGQDRYMIYCALCHDPLGTGTGKIVERGYTAPPSYHIERLRTAPVGHFFDVITNGYGSMPDYKEQVPPRERWAIVAYIRALQLSQHFPAKDLPDEMRKEWENQKKLALGRAPSGGPSP